MNNELSITRPRPFSSTPDTRFYFPHRSVQSALETAVRALVRAEGPVLVLGGSGFGKSLLAELISEELSDRMDIVKLHSARLCSRQALLQSILYDFRMPYRHLSEGELRLSILDRLEPSPETAPDGVLMIVDEAHTLHPKLLDELRLLSNFTRNGKPRVRLLFLGDMRLEDTFASPLLDSLNQRLAARCYLQPMNRDETFEFVRHQLRVSGRDAERSINLEALQAVYSASQGVPRLANQLMDHALLLAAEQEREVISLEVINDSWDSLQHLPAPWSIGISPTTPAPSGNPIEFATLDESDSDLSIPHKDEILTTDDPIHSFQELEISPNQEHNFFSAFSISTPVEIHSEDTQVFEDKDGEFTDPTLHQPPASRLEVWENDPPLWEEPAHEAEKSTPRNAWSKPPTEQLFGNDFDAESIVPNHPLRTSTIDAQRDSVKAGRCAASVPENYLTRMQQVADEIAHYSRDIPTQANADCNSDSTCKLPGNDSALPQWSLDVGAQQVSDRQMEESIEDIVSQLNFSAFSVEPFSVEQIPMRLDGNPESHLSCVPYDSVRTNDQQQILMLHRPTAGDSNFGNSVQHDDDRDLLIIEEQVTAGSQLLDKSLPSEPAQKLAPYHQLFARLRK